MGIKLSDFTINGFDISEHQGIIDWSKVMCDFVAIRVGYGRVIDSQFERNWKSAKGKFKRVPYWYMDYYSNHISTSPVYGMSDVAWGIEQAVNCWNAIKDDMEGIVFLDIESMTSKYAPKIEAVQNRVHKIARAFLEEIDRLSGKRNGMYIAKNWLDWYPDWFRDRPLWVAWYVNRTANVGTMSIVQMVIDKGWKTKPLFWQYASDGDVDDNGTSDGRSMGMKSTTLDLNGWVATQEEYMVWFGSTHDDEAVVIPPAAFTERKVNVSSWSYLNIRVEPSNSGKVIGRYFRDAPVNISSISNGWAKLYGQPGYISEKYLK